ncbi:hypothetical protein BX600DRAFT_149119 [Xylariales sp. PMI_506]|nr:hypothetical protein BX600DRAFT_149119 [Xylariales sp. PMI_506]
MFGASPVFSLSCSVLLCPALPCSPLALWKSSRGSAQGHRRIPNGHQMMGFRHSLVPNSGQLPELFGKRKV